MGWGFVLQSNGNDVAVKNGLYFPAALYFDAGKRIITSTQPEGGMVIRRSP